MLELGEGVRASMREPKACPLGFWGAGLSGTQGWRPLTPSKLASLLFCARGLALDRVRIQVSASCIRFCHTVTRTTATELLSAEGLYTNQKRPLAKEVTFGNGDPIPSLHSEHTSH